MATQNQRQAKPQVVIPEDIAIDGEDFLVRYGEVDQVLDDARGRIRVESRTPRVSILRFDEHSISTRDFCLSAAIARMGDAPRGRGIEYVLLSQAKIQGLRKQIIAAYEGGALELNNSVTMGPVQRINGRNFWKLVISSASLERWLEKCDRSLKIEIGTSQTSDAGLQEDREPSSSNRPVPKQRWQEEQILNKIKELKYDPKALPKNKPGKPGVKAEVKLALGNKGAWCGTTVFGRAWERLSDPADRRIMYLI